MRCAAAWGPNHRANIPADGRITEVVPNEAVYDFTHIESGAFEQVWVCRDSR